MNRILLIAALAAAALASGCATTKYQCPTPSGVACMSASQIYKLTNAPGKAGMDAAAGAYSATSAHAAPTANVAPLPAARTAQASLPLPRAGDVVPIRQQSRVMRIWIAPFEDDDGNLLMATRIYTDMESKRWSVGEPTQDHPHAFFPMQVDPSAPAPTTTTNSAEQPGMQTAVPGTDNATP